MSGPSPASPPEPAVPTVPTVPTVPPEPAEPAVRRLARAALTRAVRGGRDRGTEWGEAILGELEETTGSWEAARWAVSGLRVAWRERRRYRPAPVPLRVRVGRRILVGVLVGAVAGTVVHSFVAGVIYIPSTGMGQALQVSDRVLVDKLTHRLRAPHYGEVVLASVRVPDAGDPARVEMPRRVVGLPGDRIDCRDGHLYRNGAPVEEPYLAAGTTTECGPETVAPHHVYLLGDNRSVAVDSRTLGSVAESNVVGTVVARVWPLSHLGPPST